MAAFDRVVQALIATGVHPREQVTYVRNYLSDNNAEIPNSIAHCDRTLSKFEIVN